jgi:hypothetical protein
MASTTNYNWNTPDNSGLVKNGAQDIRTLGDAIDTAVWNIGFGQAGKNRIINGDFGIWQRGTSFSNPANGVYCADRFKTIHDGTGATRTISQQSFTAGTAPVAGYEGQFFMRYAVTVAGSGNNYQGMWQLIEDVRTFANQPITISFWAKADANRTVNVDLFQNFGSGGSTEVSVTLSAPSVAATTSWQRFTLTASVPSIAGKTIGAGSNLRFGYYAPPATACTIDIWGVQIEYGSKATPFQTATGTIQGELAACQRYYQRIGGNSAYEGVVVGIGASSTLARFLVPLKVTMRVAPTSVETNAIAVWDTATVVSATGATLSTAENGPNFLSVFTSHASGITQFRPYFLLMNNSTSAFLGINAEL